MRRDREGSHRVLVLAAALLIRLAIAGPSFSDGTLALRGDSGGYISLATNLLEGNGFSEDSVPPYRSAHFRPPVYPAFVAGLWGATHRSTVPIALAQIVLDLLTCWLVMKVARALFGHRTELMAGSLYATSLVSVAQCPVVMSETLFTFLATLLASVILLRRSPWTRGLLAGVLWGAATLTRSVSLFLAPVVVAVVVLRDPHRSRSWGAGILCGCAALVTIGPWLARNHSVTGKWTVATVADYNLLAYNAASVEAERLEISDDEARAILLREVRNVVPPEAQPSALIDCYREHARRILLARPLRSLRIHLQRDLNSLLPALPDLFHVTGTEVTDKGTLAVLNQYGFRRAFDHYFGGNTRTALLVLPWVSIWMATLILAAWGWLVLARDRHWASLAVLCGFAMYYLAVPGAPSNPRFSAPAAPLLTIAAGAGLNDLVGYAKIGFDRARHRTRKPEGVATPLSS